MKTERITHAFDPVFDSESRILVLGTMPSPKSSELGFYYSHPRNRFWPVMAEIFGEEIPKTPEEKKNFCLRNKIALWDVLAECDIEGASDSSIKNAVPNNLMPILTGADIKKIFVKKIIFLITRVVLPQQKLCRLWSWELQQLSSSLQKLTVVLQSSRLLQVLIRLQSGCPQAV